MNWVDKIYIISLGRHEFRRNRLYADLRTSGFDVSKIEIINAVNGNDLDINQLINDNVISDTFIDPNGLLTKAIYGCALSHQIAYHKFLETPNVETALILEDDAALTHTGLRILFPQSDAYRKFLEEKNKFDWDVIMVGGASKIMPYYGIESHVMKPMVRYPEGYAAHSYIINRSGAEKLIKGNQPIQFAADVSIHCSGAKIYCTPISYFSQKVGEFDRWHASEVHQNFVSYALHGQNKEGNDNLSSTTYGDMHGEISKTDYTADKGNSFNTAHVSKKLPLESVVWKPFIAPNGDEIDSWAHIKLKTKTNE